MKAKKEKKNNLAPVPPQRVKLRDGTTLTMGDEVSTDFHPTCSGLIFVICEMNPFPGQCESGFMIVVHLKGEPDRKILGFKKEGMDLGPDGIDGNWFRKIETKKCN